MEGVDPSTSIGVWMASRRNSRRVTSACSKLCRGGVLYSNSSSLERVKGESSHVVYQN